MESLCKSFKERFGHDPAVCASAPGRLEILGNHTDYNEGFVLSAAVDLNMKVVMSPAPEGTNVCRILENGKESSFDCKNVGAPVKGDWLNYVKGVLVELDRRNVKYGAFDAAMCSTVPLSAGMSSSAALEMAFCFALKELFKIELPLSEWARVGQAVENRYLGVNTGLLDQFSSIYGKKNALILCDFRSVEVLRTVPVPDGWSFVVANTLVKHNLVESDYNLRRQSCEKAREAVKQSYPEVKALRDVNDDMLEKCKKFMDFTDYKRAKHVVGEDRRVFEAVEALDKGDVVRFGKLLFQSHDSSKNCFENSCPELDALVELASSIPDCAGARLSGGGFGGISIHLVKSDRAQEYAARLSTAYKSLTGKEIKTILCGTGDGAAAYRFKA